MEVQSLYQDKTTMEITRNEFTRLNGRYQTLTTDLTKDNYTGRYRFGLKSSSVPVSSPL